MREYHLKQLMWQGIPPPPAGERFHPRAHATWSSALTLIDSIRPISDFSRKPAEHSKRLKKTGQPEVLTVNGKAEIVIQDAKAYEEMVSVLHSLKQIAKSKKEHDTGKSISANKAFSKLSKKLDHTENMVLPIQLCHSECMKFLLFY